MTSATSSPHQHCRRSWLCVCVYVCARVYVCVYVCARVYVCMYACISFHIIMCMINCHKKWSSAANLVMYVPYVLKNCLSNFEKVLLGSIIYTGVAFICEQAL